MACCYVGRGRHSYTGSDPVKRMLVLTLIINTIIIIYIEQVMESGITSMVALLQRCSGTWVDPASTAANSSDAWALAFSIGR